MTTMVFKRHPKYTELVLHLASDEELGLLDSGYLEDFYGVDGRVTLWHEQTEQEFAVTMVGLDAVTPQMNNDVFLGRYPLHELPDGLYELRFRCRDLAGNYTISNQVNYERGDEALTSIRLEIVAWRGKKPKAERRKAKK